MPKNKPDVEELLNQLKLIKEEVTQIKKKLSVVSKDKEQWFVKKREISDKIRGKISSVKEIKGERNTFTEEAKKAKIERDRLNTLITEKIKDIKRMKKDYKDVAVKNGVKGDPGEIKKQIERMEFKMQTEPMKFDREQKMMKAIKDLQKQFAGFEAVQKEWESVTKKSKEIDELKKQANEYQRVVQNSARSSQKQHESLLVDSEEIDDLKKAEEDAYKMFFEQKTVFKDVNDELKKKLKELNEIKEKLEGNTTALKAEAKKKELKSLKERTAEVEEKVKQRKKLTTEDLLVMQRTISK